jgi:cbb3-type cytochrome oxidase subunit 3
MKKLIFTLIAFSGFAFVNVAVVQAADCLSYGSNAREIPNDDVAWQTLYNEGGTISGCPATWNQLAPPSVTSSPGTHCCMTPTQASLVNMESGFSETLANPVSTTGASGIPQSVVQQNFLNQCNATANSVVRPLVDGCPMYHNEVTRNNTSICCAINQSSIPTGTAGAISEAQCQAKYTGAYCGLPMGGDGCNSGDKPIGTCAGTGFLGADETCCANFDRVCVNSGGTISLSRWGCSSTAYPYDTLGIQLCCMERTPEEQAAYEAAQAANGGGGAGGGGGTPQAPAGEQVTSGTACSAVAGAGCVAGNCAPGYTQVEGAICPAQGSGGVDGVCCRPTPAGGGSTAGTTWGNPVNSSGGGGLGATAPVNITLSNPLKYGTVEEVLTSIMSGIKGIVVTLALLMIVIGGIMYIFSAGNDGRMKVAKNIILAALIGLAIVIAAPAFLKEISTLLGWDQNLPNEVDEALTLTQIASNILKFLLSIIGILALIMMVISGIMYLFSGGSEARVKQAKNIFVASLIGILVAMGSLVLVTALARFFT